jgi:hypothetical protein
VLGLVTFSALAVPLGEGPRHEGPGDSQVPPRQTERTGQVIADGHVHIDYGGQTWTGEHVLYNFTPRQLDMTALSDNTDLVYDYGTGIATGTNGVLVSFSNGAVLTADRVRLMNGEKGKATPARVANSKEVSNTNTPSAMINVKVYFVELPESEIPVGGIREYLQEILDKGGSDVWRTITNAATAQNDPKTAVLRDRQSRFVREELKRRGAKPINQASVTTLSGRQTQIQWTDLENVVEINPLAMTQPGVPALKGRAPSIYITTQTPFGGRVDLVPVISEDGAALSLSLDATISEFLGYDAPAAPAKVYVDGMEQQTTLPIPAIRVRGVQATAEIPDGGTLVLLEAVAKSSVTNKVPMLGDVPLLGKLFQTNSAARNSVSRRFILFATVNLIDPTGNPIHAPNPQDSNGQK